MSSSKKFKLFDSARLKYEELRTDIYEYIKNVYNTDGAEMNTASPFVQILNVIAHLGRMILFYIESAMTETNINTAVHQRSIRAIATLTGHNPSRGIAARGGVNLIYNRETDHNGDTITIKNYSKIKNKNNGLEYIIVLPSDSMEYIVGSSDNETEVSIIQGTLATQQFTGTGQGMQSFNVPAGSYDLIDDFYVNVYVNGDLWTTVESFIDMSYNEKACVVKTSANTGLDVFFGNKSNGAVPEKGSTITVEYLICSGSNGNIQYADDTNNSWEFVDNGYLKDGTAIDLNEIFVIKNSTDILFGAPGEDISVTRALAPHASRSFVLANNTNYEYFLRKLNMFSVIETIQGFNSYEDSQYSLAYSIAEQEYVNARDAYYAEVSSTGKTSKAAKQKYVTYTEAQKKLDMARNNVENSKLDDNVVYLLLVPKLENRIAETNNYFTCDINAFKLTETEKTSILDLLDNCGQKLLTVDNEIIDPKTPKFAMNVFVQIWSDFEFNSVKSDIISAVSEYLLNNTRRDRIPVSDIISVIEKVSGVDAVSVFFDADVKNASYYGTGSYGIDDFGDVVLAREVKDVLGNIIEVRDLYPLFRGGFTGMSGIEYSDDLDSMNGPINITLRGKSDKTLGRKLNSVK